ncbi:MAG TPA: biopolymer transporter ExbD [Planctomycetaceae bacterium]|nr:biopolymer transporter ExbD [Planctomycetaceae bacterium]
MRIPDASLRRTPLRFNITPMIDVVFLLIIFFLVASYFIRSEQSREVALPVASKGQLDDVSSPHRLTITIEPEGHLSVGGIRMSETQILKRIEELNSVDSADAKKPEVRIRSDRNAKFGSVRTLIEHCAASDIRSIRFAVSLPEE